MTNENKKCSSDYNDYSDYRDKSQEQQQQQLLHTMEREFTATRVQKLSLFDFKIQENLACFMTFHFARLLCYGFMHARKAKENPNVGWKFQDFD